MKCCIRPGSTFTPCNMLGVAQRRQLTSWGFLSRGSSGSSRRRRRLSGLSVSRSSCRARLSGSGSRLLLRLGFLFLCSLLAAEEVLEALLHLLERVGGCVEWDG